MSAYIPVVATSKPCETCGTSPAYEYTLAGITGVLCSLCLNKEVENVNNALEKAQAEKELQS